MSAHLTPRHRRLLLALPSGPISREDADRIAGAGNGPDEVLQLRRRFALKVPCVRKGGRDRDGHRVEFGVHSLAESDRTPAARLVRGAA
jgi:hypothetical protein